MIKYDCYFKYHYYVRLSINRHNHQEIMQTVLKQFQSSIAEDLL